MNISSISSVTSNQPVAWPTPTQQDPTIDGSASKPHGAHHHHHRGPKAVEPTEATETTAVPDQDGDQDDGQRVSNLADRVNARLQNAITTGNLSADQTVALKDAAAKFQTLMTRIGNAGNTDETKRATHFALQQLSQQIQDIFHPQGTSPSASSTTGSSGPDIAAAITAPAVDTVA